MRWEALDPGRGHPSGLATCPLPRSPLLSRERWPQQLACGPECGWLCAVIPGSSACGPGVLSIRFIFAERQGRAVPGPSVFPSGEPGVSGDFWGSQEGWQDPFRPSGRKRGLPLRRRRGQGSPLAKSWEPRGFSRVAAGFSSYNGDLSLPLGLALGIPIFPSSCKGNLGVALESLQGRRDLT